MRDEKNTVVNSENTWCGNSNTANRNYTAIWVCKFIGQTYKFHSTTCCWVALKEE